MPRKSPYEHKVKEHTRSGITIGQYKRGKGKKPSKPRKIIGKAKQKGFKVTVDHKSYPVEAVTFGTALKIGLSKYPKIPTHVKIRRQDK